MRQGWDCFPRHPSGFGAARKTNRWRNLLEQLRDETPQSLAVARLQVDEFNAGASRCNVAYDRSALDLAKAAPHFQVQGVADRQALIGFQERSAKREDTNARGPAARSRDGRRHGGLHSRAKVSARP